MSNFNVYTEEHRKLVQKYERALNAHGGIRSEHMAVTTAVLLNNYFEHLQRHPELYTEAEIKTGNIQGVNLALVGLIRRAIPELVGAELVGVQAMPTPTSPIFHLLWKKAMQDSDGAGLAKGQSAAGDEYFGYGPDNLAVVQTDPYFTSAIVDKTVPVADWDGAGGGTDVSNGPFNWRQVIPGSVVLEFYDAAGVAIARYHAPGPYTADTNFALAFKDTTKVTAGDLIAIGATSKVDAGGGTYDIEAGTYTLAGGVGPITAKIWWEYIQETNLASPEITFDITSTQITLIRRMLRGKFSVDAEFDAQQLWGISIDNEMMEMMRVALQNEINREIIDDLRSMAAITRTINYTTITGVGGPAQGNYDDAQRYLLDVVNGVMGEIYNQGRLGYGNWIVANPTTATIFERVPGFVGSGVNADSRGMQFVGSLGGRIKIYRDPQYPKNELLCGYKGNGAIDSGYIHGSYLPITASPLMFNEETGDRRRVFHTRYGKTFERRSKTTGNPVQHIKRGEWNYARISLVNWPTI